MVPRPRLDANGNPLRIEDFDLDRPILCAALSLMAKYMSQQHQGITMIAVGGAVNVMLLRTPQPTHDVDLFGTNIGKEERIKMKLDWIVERLRSRSCRYSLYDVYR